MWRMNPMSYPYRSPEGEGAGTGGQGDGTPEGGAVAAPAGGGILSRGGEGAPAAPAAPAAAGAAAPAGAGDPPAAAKAWAWNEKQQGEGEAPEWFKGDKFKTVEEQAKALLGLEKKLGPAAELIGAPEGEYELPAPPEGVEGAFEPDDPLLAGFTKVAKEMGLSQKAFNTVIQSMAGVIAQQNADDEATLAEAMSQLGNNAQARVAAVKQYVVAQVGEERFAALDMALGNNPQAFLAFEHIVAKAAGDARLATVDGQGSGQHTRADIEAEQNKLVPEGQPNAGKRMYEVDANHRKKVDGMWKTAFPGEDVRQVG